MREGNPSRSLAGRRILIVLESFQLGGAERQAVLLAKHLARHEQAQVEVWGFHQDGPVAQLCDLAGLHSRIVPTPWMGRGIRLIPPMIRFARAQRRWHPDIIVSYCHLANVACALTWRFTGACAFIWQQRDVGLFRLSHSTEFRAIKETPRFIANSLGAKNFLVQEFGVDPKKIRVIPNGVALAPPQLSCAEWRQRLGVNENSFVACMVANLSGRKDHPTLLHAWQKVVRSLRQTGVKAKLALAGRFDDQMEALRALTRELGLDETVVFLGAVDDVAGLLGAVELGILSSRDESCPNTILEYMAAGLPIVGTDILGIRSIVPEATQKFLARPGDNDNLAEKILAVATQPSLRRELGELNKQHVHEHYSSERMAADTVAWILSSLKRAS